MRIIIVRHAEPDYEKDSLTEKGWREARLLAERLKKIDVKAFYCSPLGRAKDTASFTLEKFGASAVELPWLTEFRGKIRKVLKLVSCWDRLPSEWTTNEDFYSAENWKNTKLMNSANVSREYKFVCDGIDSLAEESRVRTCRQSIQSAGVKSRYYCSFLPFCRRVRDIIAYFLLFANGALA